MRRGRRGVNPGRRRVVVGHGRRCYLAGMTTATIAAASTNVAELSVSEIARALKRTVEDAFGLVRVRGELSGLKRAASGHLYFSLKDDEAVLDAVCWRGNAQRVSFRPEDGLE